MLFDAYSQFEESMITAKIEAQGQADLEGAEQLDLDMRLARLERLMARRGELLSSVLLRQNPHNVHEWLKRAHLFEAHPAKIIHTFATAVKTVDPQKALGKPQNLWLAFALFYEANSDVKNARVILRKATLVPYKVVDDLAAVWMGWAEMELRHKKYDEALKVLKEATKIPPAAHRAAHVEEAGPVQGRLYKHTKLWSFYADLQARPRPPSTTALFPPLPYPRATPPIHTHPAPPPPPHSPRLPPPPCRRASVRPRRAASKRPRPCTTR